MVAGRLPRRCSAPRASFPAFGGGHAVGGFLALGLLLARASGGHIHVDRPNASLHASAHGHISSSHSAPPLQKNASAVEHAGEHLVNSSAKSYTLAAIAGHQHSARSGLTRGGSARTDSTAIAFLQPNGSRSLKVKAPVGAVQNKTSEAYGARQSRRPANHETAVRDRAQRGRKRVAFLDDGIEDYAPLGTSLLLTSDARSGGTGRNGLYASAAEGRGRGLHLGNSTLQADSAKKQKLTPQSWFAITFSFAFIVKCLCMLSNVVFQVSPLPQVLKFNKQGDTFETDAAPFMSILYGGCQWCFYGFFAFLVTQKSGFLVLVYSNVMGAVLGSYYIWVFQSNCISAPSLRKLHAYYQIAGLMVLLQLCALLVLTRQKALFFCGLVSSVCSVIGACSLLATLPTVLETKSSKTINKPILCAGFLGAVLWALCGFMLWDPLIFVPNIVCMCFQTVAFGLVLYFPGDGPPTPCACESSPRATSLAAEELQNRFLLHAHAGASTSARGKAVPNYGSMTDKTWAGETGGTF